MTDHGMPRTDGVFLSTLCLAQCVEQAFRTTLGSTKLRAEALSLYREAYQGLKNVPKLRDSAMVAANGLSQLLVLKNPSLDDYRQALHLCRLLQEHCAAREGENSQMAMDASERMALCLCALKRYEEALPILRSVLLHKHHHPDQEQGTVQHLSNALRTCEGELLGRK